MIGRLRKRCGEFRSIPDGGFTIIEVLVAAFILVLGALAVFMTFAAAIHNVQRGKETQQGVNVAQREMERIRVEPFRNIAVEGGTVTPTPGESKLPTSRVGAGGTTFEVDREGGDTMPLVAASTPCAENECGLPVGPLERESEDGTKVDVYRFVVCEEGEVEPCLRKRIVVDVLPIPADNQSGYQHSYYELQSTIVEPESVQ
ncbi:MAG: prepilin-type N-terminal cleavage/methylation domain-containing protein [Solirubrobacterales bacterium]